MFRPYQPDRLLLLAPDLREWLPAGHLAHHVSDLVDSLELSGLRGFDTAHAPPLLDQRRVEVLRDWLEWDEAAIARFCAVHPGSSSVKWGDGALVLDLGDGIRGGTGHAILGEWAWLERKSSSTRT